MENQVQYYDETAEYRDRFDEGISALMSPYTAFRRGVYSDGALSAKHKRLMALVAGLAAGCSRCIIGQTKDAVNAGASKAEVLEAVAVAIVMGGTAVSAESWRVVKTLEEMGRW
jgi:AhpD family alkylhydroperoxidase